MVCKTFDRNIDIVYRAFFRGGCAAFGEYCLENLRALLVQQYHFFLPENDEAASYEQTLPLFRMYGQLYVDTLLDQIHVAKKRGRNVQAVEHAKALIARVEEFTRHAQNSVQKIVKYQIAAHVMPKTNNPTCAPLGSTQFCVCTIAIGPSKFDAVDPKGYPTDKTKNFCVGITYGVDDPCRYAESGYRFKYKSVHEAAIETYWKLQLGDAVAAWGKIAETLKPMVANHKRSLSLPERIKFERDVTAVITKEKRAMYKRVDA